MPERLCGICQLLMLLRQDRVLFPDSWPLNAMKRRLRAPENLPSALRAQYDLLPTFPCTAGLQLSPLGVSHGDSALDAALNSHISCSCQARGERDGNRTPCAIDKGAGVCTETLWGAAQGPQAAARLVFCNVGHRSMCRPGG